MKIVKLKGGVGNQMFQYAFAKLLERRTGEEVKLDLSTYSALKDDEVRKPRILKFKLSLPVASQGDIDSICKLRHGGNSLSKPYKAKLLAEILINRKYYFEWDRAPRDVDALLGYDYFDGYWQAWRYVDEVFDVLQREFVPNYELHASTMRMLDRIERENSIFVGIRRGDYVKDVKIFGSFGQDYYEQAMRYMDDRVENPVYYIFSNDIEWVKQNLDFGNRAIVYREKAEIVDDFEDLMLMMHCRHAIMVNSTYHWWGSRMHCGDGKIVIAPEKWFFDNQPIDVVPPGWVKLQNA